MTGRSRFLSGLVVTAAAGLAAVASAAAQSPPDRAAYAWRFPLSGGDGAEYRSAELPAEVYRSVSDVALRDIGVYNASGQPVPRIVQAPRPQPAAPEQTVKLNAIPLPAAPAQQREQLLLILRGNVSGASLALDAPPRANGDNGETAADRADAGVTAYIVDLREAGEPFDALQLDGPDGSETYIGTVRVETGDDLQSWRPLGSGTLARLAYEDTVIERKRIELRGRQGDFLRITGSGLPDNWALRLLTGVRSAAAPAPARDGLTLDAVEISEDGRTLTFDAGGYPPVEQVGLLLPDDNVVLRARLMFRAGPDDRWRLAHEGLFYHLRRDGAAVASGSAPVERSRAAQWQVRIESGAVGTPPRLRLGWEPERLIFVAQGEGPFELVTGRALDQADGFPQERLFGDPAIFRMLERGSVAGEATIGSRQPLAGPDALAADDRVFWRTVLVWAALIGAVLVVAWLVLSLLREMQRIPPAPAGSPSGGDREDGATPGPAQSDR